MGWTICETKGRNSKGKEASIEQQLEAAGCQIAGQKSSWFPWKGKSRRVSSRISRAGQNWDFEPWKCDNIYHGLPWYSATIKQYKTLAEGDWHDSAPMYRWLYHHLTLLTVEIMWNPSAKHLFVPFPCQLVNVQRVFDLIWMLGWREKAPGVVEKSKAWSILYGPAMYPKGYGFWRIKMLTKKTAAESNI